MKLQPYGFGVLRRPLLPRNVLISFHNLTSKDPSRFEPELQKIFSDPVLLEGIQLASGTLYEMTRALVDQKPVKGKEKLLISLYKYLIRACGRCTPFGLFAGYLTFETAARTQIDFSVQNPLAIRCRLDTSAQHAIQKYILGKDHLRSQLLFYPSSSLYRVGESYRYIRRLPDSYQTISLLSQAEFHPALGKLLDRAKKGLTPLQLTSLLRHEKLSAASAKAYVNELIKAQILVSSIELNITGQDYLTLLSVALKTLKRTKAVVGRIGRIQKKLDKNAPVAQINKMLNHLIKTDHPLENTIHTTLGFQANTATFSHKFLSKLGAMLSRIGMLSSQTDSQDLQDFTRRFAARYGQQSIPLLCALDYDYGIGYGTLSTNTQRTLPLLKGIDLSESDEKARDGHLNDLAEGLYQTASPMGSQQVALTDALLKANENADIPQLPSSFYVFGSVHTHSPQALDQGDFLFELKGLYGPSAANLLTRFCAQDPVLTRHVADMIQSEQAQDERVIYAEIAHLPDGKAGNIAQRPDLRDFEIPYLTKSTKIPEKRIDPADLFLSCPDGKNLILSSPLLKKPIMPVLSSAHNFSMGLPVYRFLCDLGSQNSISLVWDWRKYKDAPFLPRVQYDKLIISKASWLLNREREMESDKRKRSWWQGVQKRIHTPRFFTAGKGDQMLLIDSQNEHSLALLAQMLKKEGSLRITESLERPSEGLISQDAKYFANEVVIPFKNSHNAAAIAQVPAYTKQGGMTRNFTSGTRWLYIKIYCTERLCDTLLTGTLFPFLVLLKKRRIISKWFFIRYRDPEPHIRMRFYSSKNDFWSLIIKELHTLLQPMLESGMVQRVQTDRYQRELERFPQQVYAKIESVFHLDSCTVLNCLKEMATNEQFRWQGALLGTDRLLTDFGFDLKGRTGLIQTMHRQFSAELDANGLLRRQMDQNYRTQKQQIIQLMGAEKSADIQRLSLILSKRSTLLERLSFHPALQEEHVKAKVAADLVHLFLNRWFYCRHRQQELAVYHYLKKYYAFTSKNKNR